MNRIDELAAELRRYIDDLAQWREDDNEALHTAAWDSAILTVDALAQAAQGAPEWQDKWMPKRLPTPPVPGQPKTED